MAHDSGVPDAIPFRTLGPVSGTVKAVLAVLVVIGVVAAFLAASGDEPGRFWQALLFNWLFWSSLAMGMVMFAVALHVTNADWAWSIRRFALGGATFLPISFILLFPVLIGGHETYFHHWLHVTGDPVLEAKAAWLNWPGLAIRDIVVVAVLYALALAFLYYSVRPDVYGVKGRNDGLYGRITGGFRGVTQEAEHSHRILTRLSPVMGMAYAILWAIVAIDMAMSLSPHWFSTMFPVAFFWTGFHGGVAATAIAVCLLRTPMGLDSYITRRQFHDLGKLVFAFSVFWMYLNWSQYIVIWYGLLPWEQEFFVKRFGELYGSIAGAVVLLVFVLPFLGLLTRPPKMVPQVLAFFAGLILVGHWLERFLLIAPSIWEHENLPLGLTEIGIALGFAGLFLASYIWYLRRVPILPSPATLAARGSPFLAVPVTTSHA
jgi:hypothetical protein